MIIERVISWNLMHGDGWLIHFMQVSHWWYVWRLWWVFMTVEWVHASRDLKESLLPEARHHMGISIGTSARRCLRPCLQTLISRCSHGSLLEAEHSLALSPVQALINSCCLVLLRTARHYSLLKSLLAFYIVMDQTTVVTQLGVGLAVVGFLRLLAHWFIEENDVFHLVMV